MQGRHLVCAIALADTLAAGCGDDEGGLCERLPGTDFRSEDLISAVMTEDGLQPSPEFVEFSETDVSWLYTDVVEVGEWQCSGDRVSFLDGRFEADVADEDGRLVLVRDGTRYLQE